MPSTTPRPAESGLRACASLLWRGAPEPLKTVVRSLAAFLCPKVTVRSGPRKTNGDQLSICHAGDMPRNYGLGFAAEFLQDIAQEIELGRHWFWRLRKVATANDCALLFFESPSKLQAVAKTVLSAGSGSCFLPLFVNSTSDVADLDALLTGNQSLRSDVRRIKREAYRYRITNEHGDYRTFLDDFWRPLIEATHGAFGMRFDYGFLFRGEGRSRTEWELLQVLAGEEWVASALLRKSAGRVDSFEIGVIQADRRTIERGALVATYWFAAMRAKELGCASLGFMWSPPFVLNGVLRMKAKYRPRLDAAPSVRIGAIMLPLDHKPGTDRILLDNPLIELRHGKLHGVRFVASRDEVESARARLTQELRHFRGIAGLEVRVLDRAR